MSTSLPYYERTLRAPTSIKLNLKTTRCEARDIELGLALALGRIYSPVNRLLGARTRYARRIRAKWVMNIITIN